MTRTIGPTVLDVMKYGAAGDGKNDDTRAIQCAIDALPADGGTVKVPDGVYMIDTQRSVRLRSNTRLEMADTAELIAITNSSPRGNVLLLDGVSDVEVFGGLITGDRLTHTYVDTGDATRTHEWQHGIKVTKCARVTIELVAVRQCAGDGLSVNGSDIVISAVASNQNRRQGLTIGAVDGLLVEDCTLSDTGHMGANLGTKPMAGIDIEPDPPTSARNIIIRNCIIANNTGSGITSLVRATSTGVIDNVTIDGCTIENNVYGPELIGVTNAVIKNCTIRGQSYSGINISARTTGVTIKDNTFIGNSDRGGIAPARTAFTQTGWTKAVERDILIALPGPTIVTGTNKYA